MSYEHIFENLEIGAEPFALCELQGPCHIGLKPDSMATLHYILSGEGEIRFRGLSPISVSKGSLVLVPGFFSHELRSFGLQKNLAPACKPAELTLAHILEATEATTEPQGQLLALCARVTIGLKGGADLINLIHVPILENFDGEDVVQPILRAVLRELTAPNLGSRPMIRALLLQIMIEILRRRLNEKESALRWMAALRDPAVWNALRTMMDRPGDPHSVESLADTVGMSRSAFAKRFAESYGSGPMELLRDLRIRRAASLLQTTSLPVKRVAEMVGFASRSAFTRQFESTTGQTPSSFRQHHLED